MFDRSFEGLNILQNSSNLKHMSHLVKSIIQPHCVCVCVCDQGTLWCSLEYFQNSSPASYMYILHKWNSVCICIMTRHTKKASGTKLSLQLRVGQFEVRQTSSDLHDICWLFSPHHTLQHNMQLTGERALQRHHSPTCVDWGPVHHCLRL